METRPNTLTSNTSKKDTTRTAIFSRVSCWCCPLQSLEELRKLYRYFPDLWRQLEEWDGLELPSIVLLEQLRTVDKRRLGDFIGHLSDKHIRGINHALAVSIGLIESIPKKLILCLCSACADNFYGSGAYSLRRIDPQQTEKDTCTYCNQRTGYDYEIIPKNR